MADRPQYARVVVKVSGEALCRPGRRGIDLTAAGTLIDELLTLPPLGVQVALVVGGGNFLRGRDVGEEIPRAVADQMGMLATVINALALQELITTRGTPAVAMSALAMHTVCETYTRRHAVEHLRQGRIVVFAAGTGSPFFTTDTCAALRAADVAADLLVKATKVDGVFDDDPMVNPSARKYDRLTYEQVLADRLGVMDLASISLCMNRSIPIVVLKASEPGHLAAAVRGETVGTWVGKP